MSLEFPVNPTPGDTYDSPAGWTYQWDGVAWNVAGSTTTPQGGFNLVEEVTIEGGEDYVTFMLEEKFEYEVEIFDARPDSNNEAMVAQVSGDGVLFDTGADWGTSRYSQRNGAYDGAVVGAGAGLVSDAQGFTGAYSAQVLLRIAEHDSLTIPTAMQSHFRTNLNTNESRSGRIDITNNNAPRIERAVRFGWATGTWTSGVVRLYRRGRSQLYVPPTVDSLLIPSTILEATGDATPIIRKNVNVANVERISTGNFQVTFLQPYADAFYPAFTTAEATSCNVQEGNKTASSVVVQVRASDGSVLNGRPFQLVCYGPTT